MARTKPKGRKLTAQNDDWLRKELVKLDQQAPVDAKAKSQAAQVRGILAKREKKGKGKINEQKSKKNKQDAGTSKGSDAGPSATIEKSGMTSGITSDTQMLDKDDAELELERAVFGDSAAFKDEIKSLGQADSRATELNDVESEDEGGDVGLQEIPDNALFFTDTTGDVGQGQADSGLQQQHQIAQEPLLKRKKAWEDSDDDRIAVSLASVPRLRKLRAHADEDVVTGQEYIRRLQKQYMVLNPTPAWVNQARALANGTNKRRRLSGYDETDDDSGASGSDDDDLSAKPLTDLLRSSTSLLTSSTLRSKRRYRPSTLSVSRQPDIDPIQTSSIDSLSIHPTLPLLLTSGPSGTLHLHHLTPSPPAETANPLLTTVHVPRTALKTTIFHPSAPQILFSGRRRYLHAWDLASGHVSKVTRVIGLSTNNTKRDHEQRSFEKFRLSPDGLHVALQGTGRKGGGVVNVLDARTWLWRASVRVDSGGSGGGVADFQWWGDGRGLCVAGKNGEVTEWDLEREEVVARWADEGAVGVTVLTLGGRTELKGGSGAIGPDRYVGVGSTSGIVNLYDRRAWYDEHLSSSVRQIPPPAPKPLRAFDHLTTPISNLAFSPDGQLLVMSSKWKRDALRIVHTASATVYGNWPTAKTPLGRVTGVALGRIPVSKDETMDVLVVGNENGKLRLWEVGP